MIYAIGDIHGQRDALQRALDAIAQDGQDAPVVFLGDYTDRGPDSRGVLDILIEGQASGADWTFLMGNHDEMMLDFLLGPAPSRKEPAFWLRDIVGGRATTASYGVDPDPRRPDADIHAEMRATVPQAHVTFLRSLRLSFETEHHFFCHAGIQPGVPFARQARRDLLWIREPFLSAPQDHGKLIVHGHTALEAPCHYGNRLNLDGGAGYGRPLVPVRLEGRHAFAFEDGTFRQI
ncbi:Serine/threonine-protein phosphatase 1 [Roseivivax sp. THAF40]|uniref:metallophosphoesterase family protein n=1 Tax=unclassified Roseivivax TaxID=2639302 RepID=UPI001269201F|nr:MULTISPECIES: metallophosphoesterase family protein [unclassified Roseivivax]QFS81387.1 Serine/threonine-protein phosphatase 1 [Roseivivax sp. THAF197b]QFT45116.1 Serine/threonine-protein phosphatase 1 [Roseivivax sp. THAF40]